MNQPGNFQALEATSWRPLLVPACELAESPRWVGDHWVWVDIEGKQLHRCWSSDLSFSEQHDVQSLSLDQQIGCVLPCEEKHTYALFGRHAIQILEWPEPLENTALSNTLSHPRFNTLSDVPFDSNKYRFNDGCTDSWGRAWVSSLSDARQTGAALYCIEGKKIQTAVSDLIVGNGAAFCLASNTLFFNDTRMRSVWRSHLDHETGKPEKPELIARFQNGSPRPDGATVLSDGSYLVAIYEGYRLDRLSPDGQWIESIDVPFARPTMPCVGGMNMNQLLVSSAKPDLSLPNKPGFEKIQLAVCTIQIPGSHQHRFDHLG